MAEVIVVLLVLLVVLSLFSVAAYFAACYIKKPNKKFVLKDTLDYYKSKIKKGGQDMQETNGRIPESEKREHKGLTKLLYWLVDKAGLSSGIGIVAWGAWWFIWSLIQYFTVSPADVMQQIVHENYFNQVQFSAILIALGVLIMELKKVLRR